MSKAATDSILPLPQAFIDHIATKGNAWLDCQHVHPSQSCWQYDVLKFT